MRERKSEQLMHDLASSTGHAKTVVDVDGVRFYVEVSGTGPALLLLHGTGASTHSWRGLIGPLSSRFTVIAPDLPGHGRTVTAASDALTLPGMARAVAALLTALGYQPCIVAGHSAGAAVLIRMALDGLIAPNVIISLNGALLPFQGPVGQFFSPLAKLLVLNPFATRIFTWAAQNEANVKRLLDDTGSKLDEEGIRLYARLFRDPKHVSGALAMMANWDLKQLERDMPKLRAPLVLVAASNDRSIPADYAFRVRDMVPGAKVEVLRGLGHLAHEEKPQEAYELILRIAECSGAV